MDSKIQKERCRLGLHSHYLFIKDVSELFASDVENKVYYECICLDCGKHSVYQMSVFDRKNLIRVHEDALISLSLYPEVRGYYDSLKMQNKADDEITTQLNDFYKEEPKRILKK